MLIILYKLYQDSAFPEMINSILVATYQEQSCLLRRLKSQIARGASHHPGFMGNCLPISHTC